MNVIKEIAEIQQHINSPGGLQKFGPYLLISLLTHPEIRIETVKNVNEMTDHLVFFTGDKAIFDLVLPWQADEDTSKELTEKYGWLLKANH